MHPRTQALTDADATDLSEPFMNWFQKQQPDSTPKPKNQKAPVASSSHTEAPAIEDGKTWMLGDGDGGVPEARNYAKEIKKTIGVCSKLSTKLSTQICCDSTQQAKGFNS